jgi:hypothetical protein
MNAEHARKLKDRVTDHLYAEGFRDDLMYVHTSVTYDNRVLVSLLPFEYDCETCKAKGFAPKLVEAFVQKLRPTWCDDCMDLTQIRWKRHEELTPKLKAALDRAFAVELSLPDNPFSSCIVTG